MSTKNQKLTAEVHAGMWLVTYSIHTGKTHCVWIKRFARSGKGKKVPI